MFGVFGVCLVVVGGLGPFFFGLRWQEYEGTVPPTVTGVINYWGMSVWRPWKPCRWDKT